MLSALPRSPLPPVVRYRVRRVMVWPVVRIGAVAGAVVALLPGTATAAALAWLVRTAHHTLESWNAVRLPSPVPGLAGPVVSFVNLLHLEALLAAARAWDGALSLVVVMTVAGFVVLGALAGGVAALLVAILFNAGAALGSGLAVEAEPTESDALDRAG